MGNRKLLMRDTNPQILERGIAQTEIKDRTDFRGNPLVKPSREEDLLFLQIRLLARDLIIKSKQSLIFLADFLVAVVIRTRSSSYMR